jgi:hypothetical protein
MSESNSSVFCSICNKTYRNEKTYQAHVKRSEKHKIDKNSELYKCMEELENCNLSNKEKDKKMEQLELSLSELEHKLERTINQNKIEIKKLEDEIFTLKCSLEHKNGAIETLEEIIKDLNEEQTVVTYNTIYQNETYIQNVETGEFVRFFPSDSDEDDEKETTF